MSFRPILGALAGLGLGILLLWAVAGCGGKSDRQRVLQRRAESKVRESELILLTDIRTLAQSNSQLLDDAIALRSVQ